MARQAPIVLLAMALGLSACSREASDWRPVLVDELKGSPNYEHRLGPAGDYLSATGDFNGDGIGDRVALMRDDVAGLVEFMAVMGQTQDVYPVGRVQVKDIPHWGVVRVPPGVHSLACPRVDGVPVPCEAPTVTVEKDAINVFAFNSTGRYMYFLNDGFHDLGRSERPTP